MDTKAIVEAVKLLLRLGILWFPFILGIITDVEAEGWLAAVSALLTGADKIIHESKQIKYNGLVPF